MQQSTEANSDTGEARWYAVSTRSRQEKVIALALEGLGIPHFLPLIEEQRQWSDRRKTVSVPLFPGYLFVRTGRAAESQLRLRKISGVVDLVRSHKGPVEVPESEIASVRTLLARGIRCSPHPFPEAGDRVRVVRGALAGIEGVFVRCGAQASLVISVDVIRRSVSVNVAAADVEPLLVSTPQTQRLSA